VKIRATQDNVIIRFIPEASETKGGLFLPQNRKRDKRGVRQAEVIAVGPGYYRDSGHGRFIPTTVKVGEIVLVDELAGQDYSLDINVPRQNKHADWADASGDFRIVREEEIHAVIETVE